MSGPYDLKNIGANIVYVKPVYSADLPQEVVDQLGELEQLFAVHDADGEQLALVEHRQLATQIAAQNNLTAVSLH